MIEVGLGGRFDATNVITPLAGAITTIGFDHQQHLGDTLAEIAFEKAGIIKPAMPRGHRAAARPGARGGPPRRRRARRHADRGVSTAWRSASRWRDGLAAVYDRARRAPPTAGRRWGSAARTRWPTRSSPSACSKRRGHSGIALSPGRGRARDWRSPDWPARLELFTLDDRRRRPAGCRAQRRRRRGARRLSAPVASRTADARARRDARQGRRRHAARAASRGLAPSSPRPRRRRAPCHPRISPRRAAAVATELRQAGGDVPTDNRRAIADPEEAVRRALERSSVVCVAGSIFLAGAVRPGLSGVLFCGDPNGRGS